MYGWSFVDIAEPSEDWSLGPSLTERSQTPQRAEHTLHWFTECGRPGSGEEWDRYFLQGVIHFDDLRIERADSRPAVPVDEFVAAARRWWDAFEGRDPRLSVEAQRQAQAGSASWRRGCPASRRS